MLNFESQGLGPYTTSYEKKSISINLYLLYYFNSFLIAAFVKTLNSQIFTTWILFFAIVSTSNNNDGSYGFSQQICMMLFLKHFYCAASLIYEP